MGPGGPTGFARKKNFTLDTAYTISIVIDELGLDDARCKDQQGAVEPGFREDP